MIENLRKYTGTMIAIFVILFISFLFLDTRSVKNFSSGKSMYKIAGRAYSDKEFNSLGAGSFKLAFMLAQSGEYSVIQFISSLSQGDFGSKEAAGKFFVSRMILRQAKEEFGVYPNEEEVTASLRSMRTFNGPDQKFNAQAYQNFIDRGMGPLGLSEKDLRELASDVLALKKINTIIGGGLIANRDAVAVNLALENQQVGGSVAKMELAPFEEKIEPTEEEIKKYWEVISDSFTTEAKRKFTYVLATPEPTIDKEEGKADAPETLIEAAASEEEKKATAKKKEEAKAKHASELVEDRRTKQLTLDRLVSDFVDELEENKGDGFEDLIKENKWEVKTTEFFPIGSVPKELELSVRFSSQPSKVADQLFKIIETTDPISKISEAIPCGENQWIIARLDSEEKSRAKTYEEARNEARAQYISEKATEALKNAANEKITKIKEAIAAGKSFADAAKEAGIEATTDFKDFSKTSRADGATQPQNLFEKTHYLDPSSIAEVVMESDRAFIVYLAKREVVKEENQAARIDSEVTTQITGNETIAFTSWLNERIEAAQVEDLTKR